MKNKDRALKRINRGFARFEELLLKVNPKTHTLTVNPTELVMILADYVKGVQQIEKPDLRQALLQSMDAFIASILTPPGKRRQRFVTQAQVISQRIKDLHRQVPETAQN